MPESRVPILDAQGKPARAAKDEACPNCGAPPSRRGPSSGFGTPHPVCFGCGHEWTGEVWRG